MHQPIRLKITLAATIALASACVVSDKDRSASADSTTATTAATTPAIPAPATTTTPGTAPMDSAATAGAQTAPVSDMRLEVDLKARKLRVYKGQDSVASYSVAVGSTKWPTQTGEWKISQVVWNPAWVPPDESWAEQKDPRDPGDPKNPLGRAQLVYDPPRTIHGTNEPASIGKAVSHGSIRMRNEDIVKLAKQLMESAGVAKDEAWYQERAQKRTQKEVVDLPGGIPIKVF
jgi:lipoprotein-anchoring transpeptidase ErfK/SrfK